MVASTTISAFMNTSVTEGMCTASFQMCCECSDSVLIAVL